MNSQSSFKIEQAPIFSANENTIKIDLRNKSPDNNNNHQEEEEDSEAKRLGNSLNPAINKRIK
jgi:hypothetical protein